MAKKPPRAKFALPGKKMFPLNTPGRRQAAPGLARYSEKKGNISDAEANSVIRQATGKMPKGPLSRGSKGRV